MMSNLANSLQVGGMLWLHVTNLASASIGAKLLRALQVPLKKPIHSPPMFCFPVNGVFTPLAADNDCGATSARLCFLLVIWGEVFPRLKGSKHSQP